MKTTTIFITTLVLLSGCDNSNQEGKNNKVPLEEKVTEDGGLIIRTQVKRSADGNTTIPHGTCIMTYPSGKKAGEGQYVEGKESGIWRAWGEDDSLRMEGKYVFGKKDGKWTFWNEKHEITRVEWYQNGRKMEDVPPSTFTQSTSTQPVSDDSEGR